MAPIIEIKEACKIYKHAGKTVAALQDVDFTVEKGDIYGIIGLSGAGKSTLIRCLASLLRLTSGRMFFHGNEVAHMQGKKLRDFRRSIGMIFQHFNLLSSRTVEGNVAFPLEIANIPKEVRSGRVDELLRLVGLQAKRHTYPALLSGGEKQRVGIARALASQPEILFCDEATSALDPCTTKEILDLLKTVNKKLGVTIVLITHDMEVIKRICNQVAVIEAGRIVEQGSVVDLFANPQHPTTKRFIQSASHEIPAEFFKPSLANRKLLRLRFKGKAAGEPLIAQIVKKYKVEPNILLGWIDKLQKTVIGTLVIELTGTPEGIADSITYLGDNSVQCEVLEHGS